MKIGVWIPCFRRWVEGDSVRDMAIAAEDLGFQSLWVQDHVVAPEGDRSDVPVDAQSSWLDPDQGTSPASAVEYYGEENWWLDPYALWGFLAGITRRVELASCVVVAPYRHPLVQAKMLGTLDVLSGGRMLFGVGSGHVEAEFAALGQTYSDRGPMTDEYLEVIRLALGGKSFSHRGEHLDIPQSRPLIEPLPGRRLPFYVGGMSKRAIRRAVELGDGWLPAYLDADSVSRGMDYMSRLSDEAGRTAPEVGAVVSWALADPRSPREPGTRRMLSVQEAAEEAGRFADLGLTHLSVDLPNPSLDVYLRQMELLSEVLDAVTPQGHRAGTAVGRST